MATIIQKNGKYVVVYDNPEETKGVKKRNQRTKTFEKKSDANKFKNEVELKRINNTLVNPTAQTVESFLLEWADMHAKGNWQFHTYTGSVAMIKNHIIPTLGSMELQKVTPKHIDLLFDHLRTKKVMGPQSYNKDEKDIPCLSSTTLRHVYVILKKAFDKAVEWKQIENNPVVCKAPKKNKPQKTVWDSKTVRLALNAIEHPQLHLALHLAFICSLRIGEAMGLTWDCIDLDNKVITINKTLQRVSKKALAILPQDSLVLTFPPKFENKNSLLILKSPKTDSSNRIINITEPLKQELLERKSQIEKDRVYFADKYQDFNLVFSIEDGFPVEPKLCEKWFKKWQETSPYDFPDIIFHEIRHSSTTYKLVVSNGDLKSVQADTGHARGEMVVDVYSHIMDQSRVRLISTIEKDFYSDDLDIPTEGKKQNTNVAVDSLLETIKNDPLMQQKVLAALLAQQD